MRRASDARDRLLPLRRRRPSLRVDDCVMGRLRCSQYSVWHEELAANSSSQLHDHYLPVRRISTLRWA
jgi:hypothetical protein